VNDVFAVGAVIHLARALVANALAGAVSGGLA